MYLPLSGNQLLDRSKTSAAKFLCRRIGAWDVRIDHADQLDGHSLFRQLLVHAGVIAPEGAYANDGNGNGIVRAQVPPALESRAVTHDTDYIASRLA